MSLRAVVGLGSVISCRQSRMGVQESWHGAEGPMKSKHCRLGGRSGALVFDVFGHRCRLAERRFPGIGSFLRRHARSGCFCRCMVPTLCASNRIRGGLGASSLYASGRLAPKKSSAALVTGYESAPPGQADLFDELRARVNSWPPLDSPGCAVRSKSVGTCTPTPPIVRRRKGEGAARQIQFPARRPSAGR